MGLTLLLLVLGVGVGIAIGDRVDASVAVRFCVSFGVRAGIVGDTGAGCCISATVHCWNLLVWHWCLLWCSSSYNYQLHLLSGCNSRHHKHYTHSEGQFEVT